MDILLPIERLILRQLFDNPAFAVRVTSCVTPELFYSASATIIYTTFLAAYTTIPPTMAFVEGKLPTQSEHEHTQFGAAMALLRSEPPLLSEQYDAFLIQAEDWFRGQAVKHALSACAEDFVINDERMETLTNARSFSLRDVASSPRVYTWSQLKTLPPAPWLVKDLIIDKTLSAFVAPAGAFKTFFALDLALAIATGKSDWLGLPLYGHGPVVYVIGEGMHRWGIRVQAWEEHWQRSIPDTFLTRTSAVNLGDQSSVDQFIADIDALCPEDKPRLVVFDTLSRCLPGVDENLQKEMSTAIARLDTIREHWDCAVLLVHHTNKEGRVERGSSVIRGALDQQLMLNPLANGVIEIETNKAKDAAIGDNIYVTREIVTLSTIDAQTGEPYTSCVIRLATSEERENSTSDEDAKQDGVLFEKVKRVLKKKPNTSMNGVYQQVGGRKSYVLKMLKRWKDEGTLRIRTEYERPFPTVPTLMEGPDDVQ